MYACHFLLKLLDGTSHNINISRVQIRRLGMVQFPWVSIDSQHIDEVPDDLMSRVSSSTSTPDTLVVPPNKKKAKKAAQAKAKAQKELEKRGFVMHDGDLAPVTPPLPWEKPHLSVETNTTRTSSVSTQSVGVK